MIGIVPAADGPALVETVSAQTCDAATRARVLAPPSPGDDSVRLTCSLRLGPTDRVLKRILLEGSPASGITIACNGAAIGRMESDRPHAFTDFAIEIRSTAADAEGGPWSRPSDISISDCRIVGNIRIWGMGLNGQAPAVRHSSRSLGHTERAQAAAPTRIGILDSTITALGSIPFYLAPGVTQVTLKGSRLTGRSGSTAVYLDAESAQNTIADNDFALATEREAIAVDGSARNRITGNRFDLRRQGGIRLYRNCGEGGTVRHQTPSDNMVTGNTFSGSGAFRPQAIVVNSRGGWRLYCRDDAGYPFGSSADDADGGTGNVVDPNTIE